MIVELGNSQPHELNSPDRPLPGPAVTVLEIPDEYSMEPGADVRDLALHLAQNPRITKLPGHEMFVAIVHSQEGAWRDGHHGAGTPAWVHCHGPDPEKAAELQRVLCEFWSVPGRPGDHEDTHYTRNGPPGAGPPSEPEQPLEGTIPSEVTDAPPFGPHDAPEAG